MLGYRTEIKDFRYAYCFRKGQIFRENFIERQYYDFFILRTSGMEAQTLRFQTNEVQAMKFANIEELQKVMNKGVLVERPEVYSVLVNFLFRF